MWRSPDTAPTTEQAFIVRLADDAGVREPVSVARYVERELLFLDILNVITLAPGDPRMTGWQPLPGLGNGAARGLPALSPRGIYASCVALLLSVVVGVFAYVQDRAIVDAIFSAAVAFAVMAAGLISYQRLRFGAIGR